MNFFFIVILFLFFSFSSFLSVFLSFENHSNGKLNKFTDVFGLIFFIFFFFLHSFQTQTTQIGSVFAISFNSPYIVIGGDFKWVGGGLPCENLVLYDTSINQWFCNAGNSPNGMFFFFFRFVS